MPALHDEVFFAFGNMALRISFIIPSFEQGRFIGRCLDGIAGQGLSENEFEVLVYDGGSTDDTLSILEGLI